MPLAAISAARPAGVQDSATSVRAWAAVNPGGGVLIPWYLLKKATQLSTATAVVGGVVAGGTVVDDRGTEVLETGVVVTEATVVDDALEVEEQPATPSPTMVTIARVPIRTMVSRLLAPLAAG